MYPAEWSGIKKLLMLKAASGGGTAPQTETLSGSLVTFETTKARPLKECRVDFLPVQEGSGDPSPENVRPISGWDGCTVYNIDNVSNNISFENGYLLRDGSVQSSSSYKVTDFIPVEPGGVYASVYTGAITMTNSAYSCWYDSEKNFLSSDRKVLNAQMQLYQAPQNAYYFRDTRRSSSTINYLVGSCASYPVTWQSAGTVYGGYVDLVRGLLVAEWSNIASYDGETLPGVWISDRDVYASGTVPTTGAQVVYQLAESITYPLTPQQITTIIGTNNIWSDAGDVTVTYTK